MEQRVSLSKAGAMKVPLFNRCMTLSCLYISAMALLIGLTLASFFVQATSEWAWTNMAWSIALAGGLALCLVLFLLFRAHAQSLAKAAQRSRELAVEIAEHKRSRRCGTLLLRSRENLI